MKTEVIVYVHTGYWLSKSPSCTFVTYNALALAKEFDMVYLFVKKGSNLKPDQLIKEYFNEVKPQNLHVIAIPYKLLKTNFFYYLIVLCKLYALKPKIKAVISRNVTFLPFLKFIKLHWYKQVYFESHDFYTDLSLRDDKHNRIQLRNNRLENRYIPYLTGLICLQNAQKELYRKYYPALSIHVLRTGLNQIIETNTDKKELICYIGSFDAHKGIENLIVAAANSISKPKILIIGGKTDKEIKELTQIALSHNYSSNVKITGWINKQLMSEYLKEVKVGIVSLEPSFFNTYITSPLKIFDYYSYGIPVIATDLPTTRELIDEGKTGLFFLAGDIKAFTDNIDKLYSYTELYSDMIKHVYLKANSLLWINRAKQFSGILDSSL